MHNAQFQRTYDQWRQEPFPSGSVIDELDELHAELAYVDAMVADSAIPFMADGGFSRIPEQAIRELGHILLVTNRLQGSEEDEIAHLAAAYKKYAELLRAVYSGMEAIYTGADDQP